MLCPLKIHCVSLLEKAVGQGRRRCWLGGGTREQAPTFYRGGAGMLCSLKILAGTGLPAKVRSQATALLAEGCIREGDAHPLGAGHGCYVRGDPGAFARESDESGRGDSEIKKGRRNPTLQRPEGDR